MTTTDSSEFDVVVVGGGPAGYATALYGASAGLAMAVVERDKLGGTCLHRGCIPAKEFLETASVMRTVAGAKEFGVQVEQPSVDFSVSQGRKQKVVDTLFKGLVGLMQGRGISTFSGSGELLPGRRVRITGSRRDHGDHADVTSCSPRGRSRGRSRASGSTGGWC